MGDEFAGIRDEIAGNVIHCDACHEIIIRCRVIRGYIYVLSNPSMPGLYKIGMTRRPLGDRVNELGASTGVPTPFVVEAYFETNDPEEHERKVHIALGEYRMPSKEFFRLRLEEVLKAVKDICGLESVSNNYYFQVNQDDSQAEYPDGAPREYRGQSEHLFQKCPPVGHERIFGISLNSNMRAQCRSCGALLSPRASVCGFCNKPLEDKDVIIVEKK